MRTVSLSSTPSALLCAWHVVSTTFMLGEGRVRRELRSKWIQPLIRDIYATGMSNRRGNSLEPNVKTDVAVKRNRETEGRGMIWRKKNKLGLPMLCLLRQGIERVDLEDVYVPPNEVIQGEEFWREGQGLEEKRLGCLQLDTEVKDIHIYLNFVTELGVKGQDLNKFISWTD